METLAGRGLDYPVWLDLEWEKQRNLSKATLSAMIKAFRAAIVSAGYKFGIYCNVDWYNNVLPTDCKGYEFWLARYPANDNGTIQERLRPSTGVGWQYSSKGKVSGISGNVDMDVFYKDYAGASEKEDTMTKTEAINRVIGVAEEENGYLEKKSNANLDSKTANAGSNNYTKYWRDIKPSYQGQPWCAVFVSWCFMKAFGQAAAKKLLKHWPYTYCPKLGSLFTKHANPEVGDVVIFYRNGTFAHTGIVIKVQGDRFWTIEGNTSGASGIIANGGGVCEKSYYNSKLPGTKFCRPDWSIVASVNNSADKPAETPNTGSGTSLSKAPKWVGEVTASELNVRTWAGTDNPNIKSWPKLAKGNLVDVCDTVSARDGSKWYYIRIDGRIYGFVSAKYIQRK